MVGASADLQPGDIVWKIDPEARRRLEPIRRKLGEASYERQRRALRAFLCGYFVSTTCIEKQGESINPIGSTPAGGKILKVRWGLPGQGKSGGLRLVWVAYCQRRETVLAGVFQRRENPSNEEILGSAESHP